jgi:PHP family Zn ribbon phosphoesterase
MQLAVDLHSHSGHAGGVGEVPLEAVADTMRLKGIDVFGAGDCLFPARVDELRGRLMESAPGLFHLPGSERDFLLQTEVIFSVSLPGRKNRIIAHHILLFPSFDTIARMQALMAAWGMKNTIGRPFITCRDRLELEDRLFAIDALNPLVEIIPAHIMTPDGVYGSRNDLNELAQFYGAFLSRIRVCETGLSADPDMLARIPDLRNRTFISSSDVHSAALNRIGREFTLLEVEQRDYPSIIRALRANRVIWTAEFAPAEGRYFLTGHRADRTGHQQAVCFEADPPARCPICGKPLPIGVRERSRRLADPSVIPIPRKFHRLVPLVEVVAHSLGVKSVETPSVKRLTVAVLELFGGEVNLWRAGPERVQELLDKRTPPETLRQILAVQSGRFSFDPPGFDGGYGVLKIDPFDERSPQ